MTKLTTRLFTALACGLTLLSFSITSHAEPLLNGLAAYQEFGKEKYIAAFYSDTLTSDSREAISSDQHKRMELRITAKRYSARSLNNGWIEGMAVNVPGSVLGQHADDMVSFTKFVKKKLVAGDRLTIESIPTEGTRVSVNGIELGTIAAPEFFGLLMRTWVGSVPVSSDFRSGILQAGDVDSNLLGRYEAVQPAAGRAEQIAAWKAPKPKPAVAAATPEPDFSKPKAPVIAAAPVITAPVVTPSAPAEAPVEVAQAEPEEEVFEEEEEEAPAFTAASLLARQTYHSDLLKWTYKYIKYPSRAAQRNQEGSVRIAVTINRDGKVIELATVEESKYGLLNKAALKAVQRANPFPNMPAELAGKQFEFTLPIAFRLPR